MKTQVCIAAGLILAWSGLAASIVPGDARRGAQLFESEHCVQCHSFKGRGGNTAGYGTKVAIETKTGWQMRQLFPQSGYHSLNEAVLAFGLGREDTITAAKVTW